MSDTEFPLTSPLLGDSLFNLLGDPLSLSSSTSGHLLDNGSEQPVMKRPEIETQQAIEFLMPSQSSRAEGDGARDVNPETSPQGSSFLLDSLNSQPVQTASQSQAEFSAESTLEFRSIDGFGNNLNQPLWGQADTQLLRLTVPAYEDGVAAPRGGDPSSLPSPRAISNAIASQTENIPNSINVSDWFWQWGQFLDHDLDLTEAAEPPEPFNIPVPTGDPFFDPFGTGNQEIELNRSIFDPTTGTDPNNPRQQINEITAYIDGSNVYGSDLAQADLLRANDGTGQLKTSEGNNGEVLLPLDNEDSFVAGDVRVNEQIGLTATHTLFVREHNLWAGEIAQRLENGDSILVNRFESSDLELGDFLYETARKIVGAELQVITFEEFLPILIGEDTLPEYQGYNPEVNAAISNEFSTAAFRVGHTMLNAQIQRLANDGTSVGAVALQDAFFNPELLAEDGADSVFLGLASQAAQEVDTKIVDDVRNFLFGAPGAGGFDLASLNLQRGRDHGLPSLNTVREALGLDPYRSFAELSSEAELQNVFAGVYTSINDVDLWIGGLAEDHVEGAFVGETFQAILADQFTRSRDGDRFFYLNDQDLLDVVPDIGETTLSQVIRRNSSITNIQENALAIDVVLNGTPDADSLVGGAGSDTLKGRGGPDLLVGSFGEDTLIGGRGEDTLRGGSGADLLLGRSGNDILNGEKGNDTLKGGLGEDIFVIAAGEGTDAIPDFRNRQDLIGLSQGLQFSDLMITPAGPTGRGTLINQSNGDSLALLPNVNAHLITEADFTVI